MELRSTTRKRAAEAASRSTGTGEDSCLSEKIAKPAKKIRAPQRPMGAVKRMKAADAISRKMLLPDMQKKRPMFYRRGQCLWSLRLGFSVKKSVRSVTNDDLYGLSSKVQRLDVDIVVAKANTDLIFASKKFTTECVSIVSGKTANQPNNFLFLLDAGNREAIDAICQTHRNSNMEDKTQEILECIEFAKTLDGLDPDEVLSEVDRWNTMRKERFGSEAKETERDNQAEKDQFNPSNDEVVDIFECPKIRRHLRAIMKGKIPSQRHDIVTKKTNGAIGCGLNSVIIHLVNSSFLEDDDKIDMILFNKAEVVFDSEARFAGVNQMFKKNYICFVLIPEALIKFVADRTRTSLSDAEKIYLHTPVLADDELLQIENELVVANGGAAKKTQRKLDIGEKLVDLIDIDIDIDI